MNVHRGVCTGLGPLYCFGAPTIMKRRFREVSLRVYVHQMQELAMVRAEAEVNADAQREEQEREHEKKLAEVVAASK